MHLTAFTKAGATIVGVCDGSERAAADCAAEYDCPAFRDLDDLVKRAKPDFVMAMATHKEMPAIARRLAVIGVPFGVEKPIGRNADEAEVVVEEVERRGIFAAVPLVNRYSRMWDVFAELSADERLGTVSHAHFRIVNGVPDRYRNAGVGWMLDPEISGGGSMRNLGIHAADAALQLSDTRVCRVKCASIHNLVHGEAVEEAGSALLELGDAFATIEAGYSYPTHEAGGDFEWRIVTGNAYLVDDGTSLTVATLDDGGVRREENITQAERYLAFGRDTLERVRTGTPPKVTVGDCWRAMRLIDEVYAAAGTRGAS